MYCTYASYDLTHGYPSTSLFAAHIFRPSLMLLLSVLNTFPISLLTPLLVLENRTNV